MKNYAIVLKRNGLVIDWSGDSNISKKNIYPLTVVREITNEEKEQLEQEVTTWGNIMYFSVDGKLKETKTWKNRVIFDTLRTMINSDYEYILPPYEVADRIFWRQTYEMKIMRSLGLIFNKVRNLNMFQYDSSTKLHGNTTMLRTKISR